MDAAELRAMQAPIKEHYKADPSAAVITLFGDLNSERKIGPSGCARMRARMPRSLPSAPHAQ